MLKKIKKHFISGLTFSFFNEFYFEMLWDYGKCLKLFIPGTDIPIVAFLGWPLIAILGLKLSEWLFVTCNLYLKKIDLLIFDIFSFILIFAPLEYIGSRILKLWKYNHWSHENLFFMILGYAIVGYFVSSAARRK